MCKDGYQTEALTYVSALGKKKNVFRVTVNSTEPMYYYCSVGMHCANGMVAAINPLANQTVASLKASARGKSAGKPTGVYGGVMTTVP
jgi:hypothetical protein